MASPIVCVAKKDGGVHIDCDCRYLNTYTVGDTYPIPRINEILRNLARLVCTVFSLYLCSFCVYKLCCVCTHICVHIDAS